MSGREIGLTFQDDLVRAILAGRKVRTRRPPRVQPTTDLEGHEGELFHCTGQGKYRSGPPSGPFGVPGDRIWVREAWRIGAWRKTEEGYFSHFAVDYRSSPERKETPLLEVPDEDEANKWRDRLLYELHSKNVPYPYRWEPGQAPLKWHPSIHMPRWACRLVLPITSISFERLQDITDEQAIEEGVVDPLLGCHGLNPRTIFKHLWDSIYAGRGLGWDANPWVFNVGFQKG